MVDITNIISFLTTIIFIVSFLSIALFLGVNFLRRKTIKKQSKDFGMKKKITDPILYWGSYISAFIIITIKIIIWIHIYNSNQFGSSIVFFEIVPTILLVVLTRTIGKSLILRKEKELYIKGITADTTQLTGFVKKGNAWEMHTTQGKYPVDLSNTSIYKIADMTNAKVYDKKPKHKSHNKKK